MTCYSFAYLSKFFPLSKQMKYSLLIFSEFQVSTNYIEKLLIHLKLKYLIPILFFRGNHQHHHKYNWSATTNSFHVKWDEVPTVEGYLLQLNTDLPYQAASSDSSASPNMQGSIVFTLRACMLICFMKKR